MRFVQMKAIKFIYTFVGPLMVVFSNNYDYFSGAMRNISSTYNYYNQRPGYGVASNAAAASVQPLKFGGKELERHGGLNWHDLEARWYNATSVTILAPDPLAAETPQLSPYAWCAGNPLRNIDPTGEDIWEINSEGIIVNQISAKKEDAFYIVDNEGKRTGQSISFKYGTVKVKQDRHYDVIHDNKRVSGKYDQFEVKGDKNGQNLFEFFSDNVTLGSEQEYSMAKTGLKGARGKVFITTAHEDGREPAMSYLLRTQLLKGYIIRELTHSHPISDEDSKEDKGFANDVISLLHTNVVPQFFIYHTPSKRYISYP